MEQIDMSEEMEKLEKEIKASLLTRSESGLLTKRLILRVLEAILKYWEELT